MVLVVAGLSVVCYDALREVNVTADVAKSAAGAAMTDPSLVKGSESDQMQILHLISNMKSSSIS
jgi:hypothetical protein